MDNLVLTNLVFDMIGLVAIVVGLAVASCLPGRHKIRPWVRSDEVAQAKAG